MPGTLVFDYPTAAAISSYLADRLVPALPADDGEFAHGDAADAGPNSSLVSAAGAHQPQQVLITDIRSRLAQLPGSAGNNADATTDPICAVPYDRWDPDFGRILSHFGSSAAQQGRSVSGVRGGRFGGFVLDWAAFDPGLFAISPSGGCACTGPGFHTCMLCSCQPAAALPSSTLATCPAAEAVLLDPQQRVLLEETAALLSPDSSSSVGKSSTAYAQQTAVAVGIAKLGEPPAVVAGTAAAVTAGSSYVGTGLALSAAAGRISYCYGFKGPSGECSVGGWVQRVACCRIASSVPLTFLLVISLPAVPLPTCSLHRHRLLLLPGWNTLCPNRHFSRQCQPRPDSRRQPAFELGDHKHVCCCRHVGP